MQAINRLQNFSRFRYAGLISLVGGIFALFRFTSIAQIIPSCPIKALTGVDCPGCGSVRCLSALSQGNFKSAIDQNLLLVTVIVLCAVTASVGVVLGKRLEVENYFTLTIRTLSMAVFIFWLGRLLPWEPGQWLRSGMYQNYDKFL